MPVTGSAISIFASPTLRSASPSSRSVASCSVPHLIARREDHDLWMALFADPDGHTPALMQEAPKGYAPPA
jgi:hypothetical protein